MINNQKGDLYKWLQANQVRDNALRSMQEVGSGYIGNWNLNPIFNLFQMDNILNLTEFSVVYAKPEMMVEWGASDNNEVVIIIMDGNSSPDLPYIHCHDDGTMITGLGSSVGLPQGFTRLLRGKFHLQNILNEDRKIILNSFNLKDLNYKCIHGLEPHGFVTLKNSISFCLAVTCGKFNNNGDLDFTIVDPDRCEVRTDTEIRVKLKDYYNESLVNGNFI